MKTSQRPLPLVTTSAADPGSAPSRRQFCAHACQAASLAAIGAFLPGCGGGGSPTSPSSTSTAGNAALPMLSGSVSGRTVTVPVGAGSALGTTGSAALVTAPIQPGNFLVARTSQSAFTVLTAICTHEGCTVDQFNGTLFVCPCHNSKYTTAGAVANGPASRALQPFPSTVSGDVLSFTV